MASYLQRPSYQARPEILPIRLVDVSAWGRRADNKAGFDGFFVCTECVASDLLTEVAR